MMFTCYGRWKKRKAPCGSGLPLQHNSNRNTGEGRRVPLSDSHSQPRFPCYEFTFKELSKATSGFSDSNLLGHGSFGRVYKGVLKNGREVAMKWMKPRMEKYLYEFQSEVQILRQLHHRHFVSLLGFCVTHKILVFDYVPNNTLDYHLHGKDRPVMEFGTRLRIAIGSAKGLAYLHEESPLRIVHRDIKAANILIDSTFEAVVADYGMSKLNSPDLLHLPNVSMRTLGYLVPGYSVMTKLTWNSDVFSYGVVLLELITGRRPTAFKPHDQTIMPLLAEALVHGNLNSLVDPNLQRLGYDPHEMARMVACAAACVGPDDFRPKMSKVVRVLEGVGSVSELNVQNLEEPDDSW